MTHHEAESGHLGAARMMTVRQEAIDRIARLTLEVPVYVGRRTKVLEVPLGPQVAARIVDMVLPAAQTEEADRG